MAHRTSGLNKIIVPLVNCRTTGRFLAVLSAKFPLNLCSRLCFFEPKHTTSTLCTCESSRRSAHGGGIWHYSTTCIELAMFCYILTVENIVFLNTLYTSLLVRCQLCLIWSHALPLNLTYILILLSQLSLENLPHTDFSHFTHPNLSSQIQNPSWSIAPCRQSAAAYSI
jgi:hypothetical protein